MLKTALLTTAAIMVASSVAIAGAPARSSTSLFPFSVRTLPELEFGGHVSPTFPANLYAINAEFNVTEPGTGPGAFWPCFGGTSECSTISPAGLVVGIPFYAWPLAACDNSTSTKTNSCGEITWSYEDDTLDSTDDLIIEVVARQGTHVVAAQGPSSTGPNRFSGQVVVFSGPLWFGTEGQSGRSNGGCEYSKFTCVNPIAGPVDITMTTTVGKFHITQKAVIYFR